MAMPPSQEHLIGMGSETVVTVHGKIVSVNRAKKLVTLEGPRGKQVSIHVYNPYNLEAAKAGAHLLILVKPQFELPRQDVPEGGIVSDPALHEKAIAQVREAAKLAGLEALGVRPSRLAGAEGNQEYFLHARKKSME